MDDPDTAGADLPENPAIELVKTIIDGPTTQPDGSSDLVYSLVVTNTGDVPLNNVQVTDDLTDTYADADDWAVTGSAVTAGPCSAASFTTTPPVTGQLGGALVQVPPPVTQTYDGANITQLLAGTDTLAVGQSCTITVSVSVTAGADLGPYTNVADAAGTSPGGEMVDDTDDTDAWFAEGPNIVINKTVVSGPFNNGDGTFGVTYALVVINTGNVPLSSVQVTDDLAATFGGTATFSGATAEVVGGPCVGSPTWNGTSQIDLLVGTDVLTQSESCTITVSVDVNPGDDLGPYDNTATTSGESPAGEPVDDTSTTPVEFMVNPAIDVTKRVVGAPANLGDGEWRITWEVVVANTGDTALSNVQVADDLGLTYADVDWTLSSVSLRSGPCTLASDFDGISERGLLTGTDTLAVDASCTIRISTIVDIGDKLKADFKNTAVAVGTGADGTSVTDTDTATTTVLTPVPPPPAPPRVVVLPPMPGEPATVYRDLEPRTPLAHTGSESGQLALVAGGLIAMGAAFLALSRRRRDEDPFAGGDPFAP